jgi:hypothetical protein
MFGYMMKQHITLVVQSTDMIAIFGTPQGVWEHERDSPKINIWCELGEKKYNIIGPTFFQAVVVNGKSYLEMVQYYFNPD